jgi:hypothetical protein
MVFSAWLFLAGRNCGFADIVYQNFVANIYSGEAWGVRWRYDPIGLSSSIGVSALFPVPVGMSYRLDCVALPLFHSSGATNLEIALFSNNSGRPGFLLETIATNPTGIGAASAVHTFDSSLFPVLNGGETYWIVVQPHDRNVADQSQNGSYFWHTAFFQLGTVGMRDYDFSANDWGAWNVRNDQPIPAFRIEGTVVPEPSTWALLALGSALFWCAARRRRK